MALSCALTLAHLGSPENPLLALSSEFSLTSQSHPSLPSWQSPAQGKRGLMEEEVICNYQEVKILAKIADWLDLNVGKCHLRGPEI